MAIGKQSDFVIYQEEFFGGYSEALEQNSDVFNAASAGSVVLRPNRLKGQFNKESFIKNISGLISRRDVTSTADVTDIALTQGEFVGVKIHRKIGPVANTLDSWRAIGETPQAMSFALGAQIGKAVAVEMANTAMLCAVAGITNLGAGALHDASTNTPSAGDMTTQQTLNHYGLVKMLSKMGDASGNIVAWAMHSKPFFDLLGNALTDKLFEVAGVVVYSGNTGTLNRPVIVIDAPSPSLYVDTTTDYYNVLGLTSNALVIDESEAQEIVSETVTGKENLILRVQGEYAYSLNMKGMKWDTANGGATPNDAALGTATNWDAARTVDVIKGGPGVRGKFL